MSVFNIFLNFLRPNSPGVAYVVDPGEERETLNVRMNRIPLRKTPFYQFSARWAATELKLSPLNAEFKNKDGRKKMRARRKAGSRLPS